MKLLGFTGKCEEFLLEATTEIDNIWVQGVGTDTRGTGGHYHVLTLSCPSAPANDSLTVTSWPSGNELRAVSGYQL